jgi:phage terminase large subunit-like protein
MNILKSKTIWTPDNSYLLEYHAKIGTGEIIAGQELWNELDNLAEDFENDMFFYDTKDAALRMDFMENCVRLTKSPYYGKPMKLMLWQKALIEAIYSFKMSKTQLRRFQKVLLLIARKNAKSETCAGIGLSEFFVGNAGQTICCSSNDDSQSKIIYNKIDKMREMIDPRDMDSGRNQSHIYNKISSSEVIKISDRTTNKEGRDIDLFLLDESNMMKTNDIAMAGEQSQSLKDEPLFIDLTTEGFIVDGYLDGELKAARRVINKEYDPDDQDAIRLLPWLYTQDSEQEIWNNKNSWQKSNPSLAYGVKKWDYLEKQISAAKKDKSTRIYILCKDFNIKQNTVQSWLNLEDYDYECSFDITEFAGSPALGAVDLAETTDLCSARVMLMKPDDPNKYIIQRYFIPQIKLEEADDKDAGAKYQEWIEEGILTVTEGADVDLAQIADWFYSLYTDYDIRLWKCGYDQKFSKDWIARMSYYGWEKSGSDPELVIILQNALTLSNAIKLSESDFKHQLIRYNNNAMDKWCLGNASLKVDNSGASLIVKKEAHKRIDGAVTYAILYEMYRRFRTDFKNMIDGG